MNDVNIHFIPKKKETFVVFLANINCLHADGAQFMHPLQHLGKSAADLPLLAIDSFKHMFLFPDIKEIS
jgi:hypothetical protein